tara:strand:+ start:1469 stop:1765 length:297 start_codon:yes stop_codon:yes gene_type:complete
MPGKMTKKRYFHEAVEEDEKILAIGLKQSRLHKKERTKKMYEVWYIPRIQDELVVARFDNIDDAHDHMDKIRIVRPKAHPHHYIWDPEKQTKIEERSL